MVHQKSFYRVFDISMDDGDALFGTKKEAQEHFQKMVKEDPWGRWRLYKDTEKPYLSGNFTEDCLEAHEPDYEEVEA